MITSKIVKEHEKYGGYPKLMLHTYSGMVLLMSSLQTGTVVFQGKGTYSVGAYSITWDGESFEDFNGTVELSNG